jgi:hypothetical protein
MRKSFACFNPGWEARERNLVDSTLFYYGTAFGDSIHSARLSMSIPVVNETLPPRDPLLTFNVLMKKIFGTLLAADTAFRKHRVSNLHAEAVLVVRVQLTALVSMKTSPTALIETAAEAVKEELCKVSEVIGSLSKPPPLDLYTGEIMGVGDAASGEPSSVGGVGIGMPIPTIGWSPMSYAEGDTKYGKPQGEDVPLVSTYV